MTAPTSSIAVTGLSKRLHVVGLQHHDASRWLLCLPRLLCLSPMHVQNASYDEQTETRSPKEPPGDPSGMDPGMS